ncbi:MAG TPA: hypothetical protein VH480_28825 [Streptosporangiaceae bacterium]|jgi:hypothetical protein
MKSRRVDARTAHNATGKGNSAASRGPPGELSEQPFEPPRAAGRVGARQLDRVTDRREPALQTDPGLVSQVGRADQLLGQTQPAGQIPAAPIVVTVRQMCRLPGTRRRAQINIESRDKASSRPYISSANINCEQIPRIRLHRILQLSDSVSGHTYDQYARVYQLIVNNIVALIGYNHLESKSGHRGGRVLG